MSQKSKYYAGEYEYVFMIEDELAKTPKTKNFAVYTQGEKCTYLGRIKWFFRWRQYCFFPENDCVFSKGCMNDINDFITKQMLINKTDRTESRT